MALRHCFDAWDDSTLSGWAKEGRSEHVGFLRRAHDSFLPSVF